MVDVNKNTLVPGTYLVVGLVLTLTDLVYYLFIYLFPSHLLSSPFYSLSLLVVTQIRGHILIAGSSSPLHTTVRALNFYREKIRLFPRRLASNCAYPR